MPPPCLLVLLFIGYVSQINILTLYITQHQIFCFAKKKKMMGSIPVLPSCTTQDGWVPPEGEYVPRVQGPGRQLWPQVTVPQQTCFPYLFCLKLLPLQKSDQRKSPLSCISAPEKHLSLCFASNQNAKLYTKKLLDFWFSEQL